MTTGARQAESGTLSGGAKILTDVAGYQGAGFVGNLAAAGDKVTMSFPNMAAGNYSVRIRYHAWGFQRNNVVINGALRSEAFPATGSGWAFKTVSNVTLVAGTNTVAITKEWGWIDVDTIEVISAAAGTVTAPARAAIRMQAESGIMAGVGVSARTDVAGYEGTGFAGHFTTNRDMLTLVFPNVVAGTYNVRIRYHSWGPQQNTVIVNGTHRSESFAGTGSAWTVKTLSGVALVGGTNSISFLKEWGWMNVDWIEIAP